MKIICIWSSCKCVWSLYTFSISCSSDKHTQQQDWVPFCFSHLHLFFFHSSTHIEFDYWIWLQVVIYYCVREVCNVDNLINFMWKFNIVVKGDIISKEYQTQPGIYFFTLSGITFQILERPPRSGFSSGKRMAKDSFMWIAAHVVGSSCMFILGL